MSGTYSLSRQQDIQYERDPSTLLDVDFQNFYQKLDGYTNVNKLKKTYQKKKKGSLKLIQQQKQKKSQAIKISNLIKKTRRDNIIQQFINKLKMTITFSNLTETDEQAYFSIGQKRDEIQFKNKVKTGKMPKIFQNQRLQYLSIIFKFLIFISITYMNSLKMAFSDIGSLQLLLVIMISISLSYFTVQISFMIYRVKSIKVSFWLNLYYWLQQQDKIWQFLINIGLFIQLFSIPSIGKILIIFMMKHVIIQIRKFKKIQISHVVSINFQRYWQLSKIILLNFCLAHILSIILNVMGQIKVQGQDNWYIYKNIQPDQKWFIKYIWGCYWGTNIMLSVGFGDISAVNHIQALLLIFIQTFACIILAYNISQVSKILQNMTLMDQQKKIKFKIFNQMGEKYSFQDSFRTHILNHIDKSIQKKHQLAYIEENFIQQLPEKLKYQVKRQMNKNVFQQAFFFKSLTKKVQNLLAQKVNKIFAHPQQIILKNMQTWRIFILRQGSLALTYKKGSSRNNGYIIEQFFVQKITRPQLISLKFMRKQRINGDLKALDFSILNALQINQFQNFLKDNDNLMFQYYCSQRDKTQYIKQDLQIRPCPICMNCRHDKTQCPRMHFIPLKQHIIYKKQFVYKQNSLKRNKLVIQRKKNNKYSAFELYRDILETSFLLPNSKGNQHIFVQQNYISMPSMLIQNADISKKIDKCLSKLQQGLKIIKGQNQTQQLAFDSAYNYKKYFPKNNPENLQMIFLNIQKKNEKQKNLNKTNLI